MKMFATVFAALALLALTAGVASAQYPGAPKAAKSDDPVGQMIYRFALGIPSDAVRDVQRFLATRGFYAGAIDGIWGPDEQRGVAKFQDKQGLERTAIVDDATAAAMKRVQTGTAAQPLASPATSPPR